MYYEGRGVPKDQDEGIRLTRMAADKGNQMAIQNLQIMKPKRKSFWKR